MVHSVAVYHTAGWSKSTAFFVQVDGSRERPFLGEPNLPFFQQFKSRKSHENPRFLFRSPGETSGFPGLKLPHRRPFFGTPSGRKKS